MGGVVTMDLVLLERQEEVQHLGRVTMEVFVRNIVLRVIVVVVVVKEL